MKSDWLADNLANWDERVDVHRASPSYGLADLRAGRGKLHVIEEREIGDVAGKRVLHLQCHFGRDTLTLAQRGAEVVGLDFSPRAIEVARKLAEELGLAARARFVCADVYSAPDAIPEAQSFDLVYVTWGAIYWLPDIGRWAKVAAHFVKPGGALYLAEGHPAALVYDDDAADSSGRPGFFAPYFLREALVLDDARDYADPAARLKNSRQHAFMHPLGDIVSGIIAAGLTLEWLHEHDGVVWPMFACLVKGADGLWRWPEKAWLPLAFSLRARK